jgi:uncharacterized integral membrane protein
MQLRTLLLVLVLALIALFAAVNWSAFTAPTTLSLVFSTVEAPLGLIMLSATAVIAVLFLVVIVYLQTSVLLETRRHAKELDAQRQLADQAEASRFTELRAFLEAELAKLGATHEQAKGELIARLERLEAEMRTAVETSGNTLAAYIGELEDRLEQPQRGEEPLHEARLLGDETDQHEQRNRRE